MQIVKCNIGPGIFDCERSFALKVEGQIFSGFVDACDVVEAGLKVRVLACKDDNYLIEFPRESVNGRRAWVPKTLLIKND